MALDIEDLILQPFRELIGRGKEAIANAEAAESHDSELAALMLTSAQAVVKEGDRALNRVQPLILANLERYGDGFRDAVRDNDGIFESQRHLEDLLYDLDDYVNLDTFDPAKFAELQAASKAFALAATDYIKRLRIDDIMSSPPGSPTMFPPLPPLPGRSSVEPLMISRPPTRTEQYGIDRMLVNNSQPRSVQHVGRALSNSISSSPVDGPMFKRYSMKASHRSAAPSTNSFSESSRFSRFMYPRPVPDLSSPAQGHLRRPSNPIVLASEIERMLVSDDPDTAKLAEDQPTVELVSKTPWTTAWVNEQAASPPKPNQRPIFADHPRARRLFGHNLTTAHTNRYIFEDSSVSSTGSDLVSPVSSGKGTSISSHERQPSEIPTMEHHRTTSQHSSFRPSFEHSQNASMEPPPFDSRMSLEQQRRMSLEPASKGSRFSHRRTTSLEQSSFDPRPSTESSRRFSVESDTRPSAELDAHPLVQEVPQDTRPVWTDPHPGLPVLRESREMSLFTPPLLKPPTKNHEITSSTWFTREESCNIGENSSLHHFKGFCDGAHLFKSGRYSEATTTIAIMDDVALTRFQDSMGGPVLPLGTTQHMAFEPLKKHATKCKKCEYNHPTGELRQDIIRDSKANLSKEGVTYRLRFLYKSHLLTDSPFSPKYGCLFCAQLGRTTREGDATVFTSQSQLLRHLSFHTQPLPEISGVTVLYGTLGQDHTSSENYDLHFPDPPFQSPLSGVQCMMLGKLPAARAIKSHVTKHGERPLTDPDGRRDGVLEFLMGARIIGVEYPERWGGKWCYGWHDGIRGAFPAKCVALDPPYKSDVRLPGTNNDGVVVTARWKWDVSGPGTEWLTFDKGATLANVSWLSHDSWCWSGTTKDGKVGFFPASHIRQETIRDGQSSAPNSKKRLFKLRRRQSNASTLS